MRIKPQAIALIGLASSVVFTAGCRQEPVTEVYGAPVPQEELAQTEKTINKVAEDDDSQYASASISVSEEDNRNAEVYGPPEVMG